MQIRKRPALFLAFAMLLGSVPVIAQNGQGNQKKGQVASNSTAVKASRPFRIRLGGFSFGAGYTRYSSYYPYYYSYHPFYRPWYYDPYYSSWSGYYPPILYYPDYYKGSARQPGMGEIRLQCNLKDADVFIDDALAGKARDLKALWLEPGAYNLKIQADNHAPFMVRIYVLSGKTLRVEANLLPLKEP